MPIDFAPLKKRIIPVQVKGTREGTPCWTWNGSLDAPTLKPSILTTFDGIDADGCAKRVLCHSFVNDGMVQFLSDCTHALAGQIVPLEDAIAGDINEAEVGG